jgi:hypothetical protein
MTIWGWKGDEIGSGLASRPWLIVPVCAAMHVTYAGGFLIDPGVGDITALSLVHTLFGRFSWIPLLAVAAISIAPILVRMRSECVHLCLWPQQTILFLMAASALSAAYQGRFPDGVERSFAFIFSDQCYAIYLTIAHLAATLRNARLGRYGDGYPH